MKKKTYLWSVLAMMMVALSAGLVSCGGSDGDDDPEPTVTLRTNVNDLTFQAAKDDKQSVTILCNSSWSVTSVPEWLTSSANSGYENSSITLTTTSDNKTSTPRTGSVVIISGSQMATISVTQLAGVAAGLEVRPTNIVTLCNGIAFDYQYGSNVSYYYTATFESSIVPLYSDDEFLAYIESEGKRTPREQNYVTSISDLDANTQYSVFTVGYDRNGNRGEIIRTDITTKALKNIEPLAVVSNRNHTSTRWTWSTTKNAICNTYYMMATQDYDEAIASDVYQAWLIDYSIHQGSITEMLNDGDWYLNLTGNLCAVWTWGLDRSGSFSSEIYWSMDTNYSSAPQKKVSNGKSSKIKMETCPIPSPEKYKVYKFNQ